MNFATAEFFVFYAAVLIAAWALPWNRARKLLLLASSYYFYACWDWRFLGLIALSTGIDFAAGAVIAAARNPRTRKAALVASLVGNLGILAAFKYADFFASSLADLARNLGLELGPIELEILLPVGISFFTFQSMSYSLDVYRGRLAPCRDPLDFALFVGFFPQLVAGPIVRAANFLPQLAQAPRWSSRGFATGLERIVLGLAKKVVVADTLALVVDPVFAEPGSYGLAGTWLAVLGFTAQIYCDFSGYSDIAIGTARTLGYELPENFLHPYLARNPQDFWRRWHVSLSGWLRDYLYIPLGGSHNGPTATGLNLMLTMLLGGLWHGAAWTFVAWGIWHGLLLLLHRLLREVRMLSALPVGLGVFATFLAVVAGWALFRADDFGSAGEILSGLVGARGLSGDAVLRWSAAWLLTLPLISHILAIREARWGSLEASTTFRIARATGALMGVLAFWRPHPGAFIYFQF